LKIYLRALEKSDINETYLSWLNDPEVTKYMETGRLPVTMEQLEKYYEEITNSPNHVIFAIIETETDKHIGNITLNDINWIHSNANLGIMIGEKDCWGKGYGTEAIRLITDYAFMKLNIMKVWAGMYADHKASIRAFEEAGFTKEAELRNELYLNNEYHNKVIMSIMR